MNEKGVPPLEAERWRRIEALFHEAVELPREARAAFLDEECGDDSRLRALVVGLLEADDSAEAPLDRSLEELAEPLVPRPQPTPALPAGRRVGRYRIVGLLGRGGMGTVYRAERTDGVYDRPVALKLARVEALTPGARARFDRERRILGTLQHPGIAALLDGGVTPEEGRPYLVMELVEGVPITDFAGRRGLSVRERVELARQVVEAVDYAHRMLVVHRDLKPANILVTEEGVVKLLDFGIARLVADDLELEPGITGTGVMVLTPDYAAPEQIRGDPLTTSVDVYAIGVVLYELLALRKPFGEVGRGWRELERVLRQPPPPLSSVEGLDRRTRRELDGDLDTIVGKALHKEPERRYDSALALGEDLARYLEGRPVEARSDSMAYRVSRLVRRHRAASVATAALGVALIAGAAGTLWQAREARLQSERGEAVGDFLFSLFEGADPDLNPGEPVTALELLEAGAARVDALDAGPQARADLLTTLGSLFGKIGEYDRAEALLAQAVDEARRGLNARDPALSRALDELGVRRTLSGDVGEAAPLLEEALELRLDQGDPGEIAATEGNLAAALRNLGRLDESETLYRSAIARLDEAVEGDSLAFAAELMGLGQVLELQGRYAEAEELFRTVIRLHLSVGREVPLLATATHNLGVLQGTRGEHEEAEELHRQALASWSTLFPDGHPEIARSYEAIGRSLASQGRWEAADSAFGRAIGLWASRVGPNDSHLAAMQANRANLRFFVGDFAAAAEAYREGVRIWRETDRPALLGAGLRNLGIIEMEAGNAAAADTLLAAALRLRQDLHGDGHAAVAETHSAIAALRAEQGRFPEAEAEARAALQRYDALPEADAALVFNARLQLGIALAGRGRHAEAVRELEAVHTRFAETRNPSSAERGRGALWLGLAYEGLGDTTRAAPLIQEALPVLREALRPDAPDVRRAEGASTRLGGGVG